MKLLLLVVLLPVLAFGDQMYDGLRVTWDLNPFNHNAFAPLPRDLNNDDLQGFTVKDNQCTAPGAKFRGQRYWKDSDPALITLYDVNGYIAGIQTSVLKSAYTPSGPNNGKAFQDDGDYWTLTIYFVDPSTICKGGRTADEYATQGTGTGMWFQVGPNPESDLRQAPANEADVASTTKWTLGHCFITMGNHYWYDITADMSCDDFFPFFMLYNKGKINAGGFAINGNFDSPRYEHPPNAVIGQFIKPLPTCFGHGSFTSQSTMHVYMTDWPRTGCLC